MKTFRSLCLAFCLGLLTAGASAAPFASPRGYSLAVPPGWRVNRSRALGNDAAVLAGKRADTAALGFLPTLAVKILPAGGFTLNTLKQPIITAYGHAFPGFSLVSAAYTTVGGVRALDMTFTHSEGGILIRDRQVAALKNNTLYFFTTVCPDSFHAEYDPVFARTLASVRWKG